MFNLAHVLSSNVLYLILLPILLTLIFVAMRYLMRLGCNRPEIALSLTPDVKLTQRSIMTEAETKFFRTLHAAVGKQYIIFPQLPIWTMVQAESNNSKSVLAFKNRINQKRVDFVLVDSASLKISMAIELDDRSHLRGDRQRRDVFVDAVLDQAGIKLVRILTSSTYDPQTIRNQLGLNILHDVSA